MSAPGNESSSYRPRAPLYFAAQSLLCQLIAAATGLALSQYIANSLILLALMGVAAFLTSRFLRQPFPWQIFNLVLPASALGLLSAQLPAYIPAAIAVAAILLFLPTFWTSVPYYPTATRLYDAILNELPEDREFSFIDLGCGGGSLLRYLAVKRPDGHFYGMDISPLAFFLAFLRCRPVGARVYLADFWKADLSGYDVVYVFLAPGPMPTLWEKAKKDMRPGTLFITNSFPVPARAERVVKVDESRQGTLYVHVI